MLFLTYFSLLPLYSLEKLTVSFAILSCSLGKLCFSVLVNKTGTKTVQVLQEGFSLSQRGAKCGRHHLFPSASYLECAHDALGCSSHLATRKAKLRESSRCHGTTEQLSLHSIPYLLSSKNNEASFVSLMCYFLLKAFLRYILSLYSHEQKWVSLYCHKLCPEIDSVLNYGPCDARQSLTTLLRPARLRPSPQFCPGGPRAWSFK